MRFDLNVNYHERDKVKACGARWDHIKRVWYYEGAKLPEELMAWTDKRTQGMAPDPGREVRGGAVYAGSAGSGEPGAACAGSAGSGESGAAYAGSDASASGEELSPLGSPYLSVSKASSNIKKLMETTKGFRQIAVKGEVTNYTGPNKGNHYFSLKDGAALIKCTILRYTDPGALGFELKNGQQVGVVGDYELYAPNGTTSLRVSYIRQMGEGPFGLAYRLLKEKLEAEGLFAPERKKPIPKYARRVGILTSARGKAIGDIIAVAKKNNPYVSLELYDVNVQGANAVPSVRRGLAVMDRLGYDVIIIGRGGGSDEELIAYNDESLARDIAKANTPVISAVGHAANQTLADLVADDFATTPTFAAQKAIFDVNRVLEHLDKTYRQMYAGVSGRMRNALSHLDAKVQKLERYSPRVVHHRQSEHLGHAVASMKRNISALLDQKRLELERCSGGIRAHSPMVRFEQVRSRLELALTGMRANSPLVKCEEIKKEIDGLCESMGRRAADAYRSRMDRIRLQTVRLHGLSPTAKLVNGFGYISRDGEPVTDIESVKAGDELAVTIHNGRILAGVISTERSVFESGIKED